MLPSQSVPVTNMFTSLNMANVDIQDGGPQSLIFTPSEADDSVLQVCDVTRQIILLMVTRFVKVYEAYKLMKHDLLRIKTLHMLFHSLLR